MCDSILSSQSLMEVVNFCAAMDTLIGQNGVKGASVTNADKVLCKLADLQNQENIIS